MVQVVNHLRKLGKERSLAVLREYLLTKATNKEVFDSEANEKVLFICRLLFVNPKGWQPPGLGSPGPNFNAQVAKHFRLFPIAISNGVPFLLIRGYELGGNPEHATDCVQHCEGLSLIEKDYPLAGYEKAARDLIQTDSFYQLYEPLYEPFYKADSPRAMAEMILRQAMAKKAD
jgi:hypothetical protein